MIVSEPRDDIARWAGLQIGVEFVPPFSTIAEVRGGKIVGALVFNMRTPHDIEISVAATLLPRSLLRAGFDYVTRQLGCRRATFRTRADNFAAQKAMDRLGARLEGRQRLYFGDVDGFLYGILQEDYPYGFEPELPRTAVSG